jgi:hypothetical protein
MNRHPGFGLIGDVSSPCMMMRVFLLCMLGTGMAESSAFV